MRRVMIAVAVGLGVGLGVGLAATWLWWTEAPSPTTAATPAAIDAAPAPGGLEVPALPRAEDRSRPGLRVTVTGDGRVVPAARVTAWRQLADEAKGGVRWLPLGVEVTDAAGQVTYPAVAGRYALAARDDGGRAGLAVVDVPIADEATEAQVTLGAGTVLQGRVVDAATKSPVPGALVTVVPLSDADVDPSWRLPAETHLTARADGLGRFRVEAPAGVERELHAQAPGYAHGEPLPVPDKDAATELTLSLARAATVDGVVVNASGQPVPGSTVSSEPLEAAPVVSGDDGRFTLTLAPGYATLHALTPGGLQGLVRVKVAAGEALRDVRLVAAAAGELSGRVVDADGAGVAGVEVRVLAEPDQVEVAAVQSSAHGDFTAVQLPAGRYSLFARSGNGARARQVGVELPLTAPVELRLTSAARLAGTVVNETGQPLANASVVLEYARGLGEPSVHARSDASGRFEVGDLLPAALTASATLGEAQSDDEEVYVASGQLASVTLRVVRRGRLKGRVVGGPPGRYYVLSQKVAGGTRVGFATDEQGRYDEQLVPGRYELYASRPTQVMTRFAGLPVEIRAGETTEVDLPVELIVEDGGDLGAALHRELGSGVSFDTGPGGVAVSFLMPDSPAALAGVRVGDLVLSIDGEAVVRTLDAFERLQRPRGQAAAMTVRRDGQDVTLTLK